LLEAVMLLCFGLAWPFSTLRMLRTGRPEGKGLAFTTIIWTGYLCGATAKLLIAAATDAPVAPVFWLYLLNSFTVGTNGALQWYLPRRAARATAENPAAPQAAMSG
jgi:hypothetical protein